MDKKAIDQGQLKKQMKLLSLAIDQSSEGIAVSDLDGNLEYVNEAFAKMHGYSPDQVIGKNLSVFHTDKQIQRVEAANRQLKATGHFKGEIWHVKHDGAVFPTVMHNSVIRDEMGKPIGMVATLQDIIDMKQAEESLRESEQKARQYLDIAGVVLLALDNEGHITLMNKRGLEILGYKQEELLGKNWFNTCLPERLQDEIFRVFRQLMRGEIDPAEFYENPILRKDGKERIIAWHNIILRNPAGGIIGTLSSGEDITERRKIEEALRKSEEQYRLLVENANEAIFIAQDGLIKFPNPKSEYLVGYTKLELENTHFVDIIHPKDREMVLERHQRRLSGAELPSIYSFRIINKKGEELWTQLNSVFIQWDGRPATLNFLRDITELRKLETQVQQARKMEAIGTLAGGIAHDFNNLLMGIQGNASLLLLNIDPENPAYERAERKIKNIEQIVKNGSDLTAQLLGFARGGKYEVKPTDLNELIINHNLMFARTKKEITIHEKYEKRLWTAEVDRGQIRQVLLNLYINAWQAMPGGGNLYIGTENITLKETDNNQLYNNPCKYVKISITDTGMGMDEATQQRIFEPFFTTKEMARGTGLGLASAYGIIKNHGGTINVYSKKGEGSTFNIYLPACEKEVDKEKKVSEKILGCTETVLLVDDEEMIIDVGSNMLESLGCRVLTAGSGKEAIDIYSSNKDEISIVILDMIMPDMGGGETFDTLKKINPDVKVLLSSGYSIDGQAGEILNRGCNAFIQKPFNAKELSKKISEVLDI
ncbi:MAG: PAS domain S-box protein [Thermodesulfobacteriota bacterium]|nr:PAS domain S-box protein [Thermodesulfobacteriota bacterium]